MSQQQVAQFEEQFLFDHELTAEVEEAQRMYDAFKAYGETRPIETYQPVKNISYWLKQPLPAWSLAASILLCALPMLALLLSNGDIDYKHVQVTNIDLSATRSNEASVVRIGNENTVPVLAVFVDRQIPKFNAETFEVLVTRVDDQTVVLHQEQLKTEASDMLYINLQSVPQGQYSAEIYGSSSKQSKELLKRFTLRK